MSLSLSFVVFVSFVWWGLLVIAVLSFVVVVLFVLGGFVASSLGLWWFRLLVVDVFEVVPSWAQSREGCVRRTSSAVQSGGECRRELADHRGTSRVQVTCGGLAGPVRSPRSRVIKTQVVQPDPLVCEGVFSCVSFGLWNECCGAESAK